MSRNGYTADYYVRGNDLVSKINVSGENNTHNYCIQNAHGDVVRMMDASGNVVNSYTYDQFGAILEQTEGTYNPFKYAGELHDMPDNLIYLRNRIYDPKIGRFLTEDPHWNVNNMIYGDIYKTLKIESNEDNSLQHNYTFIDYQPQNTVGISKKLWKLNFNIEDFANEITELNIPSAESISQSSNLYVYCNNNPVNYIDPSGHSGTMVAAIATAPKWGPVVVAVVAAVISFLNDPDPYARPNQKKQGREVKEKKRKGNWTPNPNKKPSPPKKHTPGRDHRTKSKGK